MKLETTNSCMLQLNAHESTSSKYRFINTAELVNKFAPHGWTMKKYQEARTIRYQGYQKHLITLEHSSGMQIGDTRLQILIINSHKGNNSLQLRLGLYRMACANGLVISDGEFESVRIRHQGDNIDEKIQGFIDRISIAAEQLSSLHQRLSSKVISADEARVFAAYALQVRFGESVTDEMVDAALEVRRLADKELTLWNTYNRVQESIIRGFTDMHGTRYRKLTSLKRTLELNEELFDLTVKWAA